MNNRQNATMDAQTLTALYQSNSLCLGFVLTALLVDSVCRSLFYHDPAWDLLGVVCASGIISAVYLARHNAFRKVYIGKLKIIAFVLLLGISAAIAFIVAFAKTAKI